MTTTHGSAVGQCMWPWRRKWSITIFNSILISELHVICRGLPLRWLASYLRPLAHSSIKIECQPAAIIPSHVHHHLHIRPEPELRGKVVGITTCFDGLSLAYPFLEHGSDGEVVGWGINGHVEWYAEDIP